ncbi:MAG TPA: biopolymer transporter ExbD [Flavobacteriales bacterium]|nr:biopolymer transporter ExbD [Flavobacteriales bacterium]
MGEVADTGGGGGKKKGKVRAKKQSTKIDMTPMVDLAFLLLTFFILTTTLAEQKTLDILLPSNEKVDEKDLPKINNAVTVILSDNDKVYYYLGMLKTETELVPSNFKDIRNVIAKKNERIVKRLNDYIKKHPKVDFENDSIAKRDKKEIQSDKSGVFVIIKYDSLAKYRNAIDIIDEMDICGVPTGRYAIVNKLEPAEKVMLHNARNN